MKKVIKIDTSTMNIILMRLQPYFCIILVEQAEDGHTIAMIPVLLEFLHQQFNLQSEVVHVDGTTVLGVRDSLTVTVVAVTVAHHGQVYHP